MGFDYAWEVEHHFLEEYSHSSAPEVFLAAASQRTKNIRLGHGIVQMTTNHPARVAEKIATLDLVSDGRVELGLGEGASVTELHPFNLRFRDKRDVWEDAVRCTLPMFWNHGWEYEGEFFKSRCARSCQNRCRSRTRRCGWLARSWTRSSTPRIGAWARCASSS